MKALIYFLLITAINIFSVRAQANCNVTVVTPVNFNSAGSTKLFPTVSTPLRTSTSTNTITCTSGILSLIGANSVTGVVAANATFTLTNTNGDAIPYSVYLNNDYMTNKLVANSQLGGTTYNFIQVLGIVNLNTPYNFPLYFQVNTPSNVAVGTYSNTFNITWTWRTCTIAIAGTCTTLGTTTGTVTTTTTVNLIVTKDCLTNTAPNVNFGSQAFPSDFGSINQNVSVTCTKGLSYKVYFSNGVNNDGTWNRMRNTGTGMSAYYLQYNIYPAGTSTTPWNPTNPQTFTNGGLGTASTLGYTAIINPNQAPVPAGTYQDTVSLVVEY